MFGIAAGQASDDGSKCSGPVARVYNIARSLHRLNDSLSRIDCTNDFVQLGQTPEVSRIAVGSKGQACFMPRLPQSGPCSAQAGAVGIIGIEKTFSFGSEQHEGGEIGNAFGEQEIDGCGDLR